MTDWRVSAIPVVDPNVADTRLGERQSSPASEAAGAKHVYAELAEPILWNQTTPAVEDALGAGEHEDLVWRPDEPVDFDQDLSIVNRQRDGIWTGVACRVDPPDPTEYPGLNPVAENLD